MPDPQTRTVTISAIAAEAGVSAPTVSRVLNGRGDVAPQTRERVEALLRRHGYQRPATQSRGRGRADLVDVVFDDLDSPWAVEILRGVEAATHAAGTGMVVSANHRRRASTSEWLQNVRARASDGAILVTTELDDALHTELRSLHVPAVVVDPAGVPDLDVPTVGATNWAGGVSATEHLVTLGHRRIAHVAGRPGLWCSRARLDGYRAALNAADLPVDPALVVEGDFGFDSGFRAGRHLLSLPSPPTAVFAASDQMALGVLEAVRTRGLRVPDDVSVVGFDDLAVARWASPPLTTVRQPLAEMGAAAVRIVMRLVSGHPVEAPGVELTTRLVVRESTAPA